MNRLASVSLGLIAVPVLMAMTTNAGDEPTPPRPLAEAICAEVPEAGSLEAALHIRSASGTVALREKVSRANLTIDLYRDGKKVDSHGMGAGVPPDQAVGEARFTVQVIDLDYLPLGGGKKGHVRIVSTLKLGTLVSSTSKDVPEDVFGGRVDSSGFQAFDPRAGSAKEIPLFHMIVATRSDEKGQHSQHGGTTVEGVLRANRFNDVLVAKLIIDPPQDQ